MTKIRYIETKPIQQMLTFESREDWSKFFEKRIEEVLNYTYPNGINYKDYFVYDRFVLKKDGTPRKMIDPTKWLMSKKAQKNQKKGFAVYCEKRKKGTFQINYKKKLTELDAKIENLRLEKEELINAYAKKFGENKK